MSSLSSRGLWDVNNPIVSRLFGAIDYGGGKDHDYRSTDEGMVERVNRKEVSHLKNARGTMVKPICTEVYLERDCQSI